MKDYLFVEREGTQYVLITPRRRVVAREEDIVSLAHIIFQN
jgi:hypothetical protein